jgi:hypothetical protein
MMAAHPRSLGQSVLRFYKLTHERLLKVATNVEHLLNIAAAMLLVASRRPSRSPLAFMLGLELLYLGVVAISVPNAPGSWGIAGGAISVFGGLIYLLDLANQLRRRGRKATAPTEIGPSQVVP